MDFPPTKDPVTTAPGDLQANTYAPNAKTLLLLLGAVYGIQYLDQILLGLLVQPIKKDLALSDTQAGLLTGVAFSLLYVSLGFPLARLADKHNRKWIVVGSVALFSAATLLCGMATGFFALFAARMCVAVGEAGTMPSAVSMLADRFRPASRRIAMAFHSSGGFLGTATGLLVLSLFSNVLTWRSTFWGAGAAGLLLAIVIGALVVEPMRVHRASVAQNFLTDIGALVRNSSYMLIMLGLGVGSIASSAAISWIPAFLARSHGVSQHHITLFLAFAWGAGATSGSVVFGYLTNWLNKKGGQWPLIVLTGLTLASPLVYMVAFQSSDLPLALVGIVAGLFLMGGIRGPAFATVQDIVPPNRQATASAGLMFSMYAIGVTLGPLITGMISDALRATAGQEALRYALTVTMAVGGIGSAALFALAARGLRAPADCNPKQPN